MSEKHIQILQKQIEKLEQDDFDLDAWKSATVALATRIFGSNDAKIKQIENLKIDYGSWALRDAKASYNPLETCKKKGKELLEAAINELEIFGLPGLKSLDVTVVLNALEKELTVSEYKAIAKLLLSEDSDSDKRKKLLKKLQGLKGDALSNILTSILLDGHLGKAMS